MRHVRVCHCPHCSPESPDPAHGSLRSECLFSASPVCIPPKTGSAVGPRRGSSKIPNSFSSEPYTPRHAPCDKIVPCAIARALEDLPRNRSKPTVSRFLIVSWNWTSALPRRRDVTDHDVLSIPSALPRAPGTRPVRRPPGRELAADVHTLVLMRRTPATQARRVASRTRSPHLIVPSFLPLLYFCPVQGGME
jgi:hypothetical protein